MAWIYARREGRLQPLAAKVPEITAIFWILKVLTTGMGESMSDYLGSVGGPIGGPVGATGAGIVGFPFFALAQGDAVPVGVPGDAVGLLARQERGQAFHVHGGKAGGRLGPQLRHVGGGVGAKPEGELVPDPLVRPVGEIGVERHLDIIAAADLRAH